MRGISTFAELGLVRSVAVTTSLLLIISLLFAGVCQMPHASAAASDITDFNGDGFEDLAIGVPGENIGTIGNGGSVDVIYGSASGLSATAVPHQIFSQNSANIEDASETDDLFGWSLANGDFNNDGYSDLAIGVPGEDVGTIVHAGAVNVIYGSSAGLSATAISAGNGRADQFWTQDSANIKVGAEGFDLFGLSLA